MKSMEELIEQQNNGGRYAKKDQFLKITNAGSEEGFFHGDVLPFYQKFREMERYEQKPGEGYQWKVGVTFVELPGFTPKAWTQGSKVWNQIKNITKEHGKNSVIKINRIGSTKDDTVYFLQYVRPMTEEEVTKATDVQSFLYTYHNLESKTPTKGPDQNPEDNVVSITQDEVDFT